MPRGMRNLFQKKFIYCYYVIPNSRCWWLQNYISRLPMVYLFKVKLFSCNMTMQAKTLQSPLSLKGMKILDREAFNRSEVVLSMEIERCKMHKIMKTLKKFMLKYTKFKSIQDTANENIKRLLFDPNLVIKFSDFDDDTKEYFKTLDIKEDHFCTIKIDLCYDNWTADAILKAILPDNEQSLSSYSIIGHIIHVNLKDHLLDYKSIIGQVLLDKVSVARTVVNKKSSIDNVYRNFELELLCGEPDYIVTVKENRCCFEFDFALVYWNPRLSTEHSRVVDSLQQRDVLFDVFCGVGPFAVPAAKKKCTVFANDLNPESFKWLNHNIKLNKISDGYIETFNKDASEFIVNEVKTNLLRIWKNELFNNCIVIVMNLPGLALDFLKCFKNLLNEADVDGLDLGFVRSNTPIVHCYFFAMSSDSRENIKHMIEERANINLNLIPDHSIHFVRNVSASKDMFKIKLNLPLEYLLLDSNGGQHLKCSASNSLFEEPKTKKLCKSE